MSRLGAIGLWMHLRSRGLHTGDTPVPPGLPGNGPLIWLRLSSELALADEPLCPALDQVAQVLRASRPDLRLAVSGSGETALPHGMVAIPDPPDTPEAAQSWLAALRPAAILLLGDELPAALVVGAHEAGVPVSVAEARFARPAGMFAAAVQRSLLARVTRVMVTDGVARRAALRLGAPPDRLSVTGPVSAILPPLRHSEAERAAMAATLRGRQLWLAAAVPEGEEDMVLAAHQQALRHSHRALLILVPADAARAPALAHKLENAGWAVAQRAQDDDLDDEVQILLAEDDSEMGLWYRLAATCYFGGTLTTGGGRHPFEAAALGSAILHGPQTQPHDASWRQLDGAGAALRISDAESLGRGVTDLLAPEQAAALANAAWEISTGGAGVARDIARPLLERL